MVMFHALRHTHASALIQGIRRGADFPAGRPRLTTITLRIYALLFNTVDSTAAAAIESVLRKPADR